MALRDRLTRRPDAHYPDGRPGVGPGPAHGPGPGGPGPGAYDARDRGAYGNEVPPGLLKPRNGAGRAALICGVLALICAIGFFLLLTVPLAIVLGLAAIVLGLMGRSRVRRGMATNRGSATLGIVTGLLSLLLLAGLAIGGVALFNQNKTEFSNLGDCLQQAGSDTAAAQQCSEDFQTQITN